MTIFNNGHVWLGISSAMKEIIMFLLPFWYHQTVDLLSHFVCCSKGHPREQGSRTQFRFVKLFKSTLFIRMKTVHISRKYNPQKGQIVSLLHNVMVKNM